MDIKTRGEGDMNAGHINCTVTDAVGPNHCVYIGIYKHMGSYKERLEHRL